MPINGKYIGRICENCEFGTYAEPDNGQEWYAVCNECDSIRMCYEPLPHQTSFHSDPAKIRAFFGGYG